MFKKTEKVTIPDGWNSIHEWWLTKINIITGKAVEIGFAEN